MSDYNDGILPEPCLRMDTRFGDEYESVEFGDGTGYIKATPILAKVGALHEEIDRLRDEEARLREDIRKHVKMPDEPLEIDEKDFYVRAFIKWATEEQPEVKRLEAENAKLRRLVHRIISHVEHPPCEGCLAEMSCDGEHVTQCDEWLFMVADARKLGIEVDA